MLKNKKIGIISLGCDKNRVDTEVMLSYLSEAGCQFTNNPKEANIIIINTCAFIASARNEAVETIDEMLKYKKTGRCEKLVVTGCMPQKYLPVLKKEFPKVDIFLGIDQYPDIVKILNKSYKSESVISIIGEANTIVHFKNRKITTPQHFAYLKIADGCNNYCTFCTIPYIRGKYRSKPMEQILEEAEFLVDSGAKELILVAQDITKYGIDLYGEVKLVELIKKLSKIKKLAWIRLLYAYPEGVTDKLLNEICKNTKVCNYLDIPLQHVSDGILKMMNRHIDNKGIVNLIERINSKVPKIFIRTTFMVGFPGETEENHKELLNFIKKYKLNHVGFFEYSKEDGTVAAKMENQVPDKIKHKWLQELIKIAENNIKINNKSLIGQEFDCVFEGFDEETNLCFGRAQFQAPEVDTLVYFKPKHEIKVGEIYKIKIKGSQGSDLKGELL